MDPSHYDQTGGKTVKNQKLPDFDGPFLGYSELPNNRFRVVVSPDIGLLGAERAGRNSPAEVRNGPSREVGQNRMKFGLGSIWLKMMARSFFSKIRTLFWVIISHGLHWGTQL